MGKDSTLDQSVGCGVTRSPKGVTHAPIPDADKTAKSVGLVYKLSMYNWCPS